jgi:hypothetical protein
MTPGGPPVFNTRAQERRLLACVIEMIFFRDIMWWVLMRILHTCDIIEVVIISDGTSLYFDWYEGKRWKAKRGKTEDEVDAQRVALTLAKLPLGTRKRGCRHLLVARRSFGKSLLRAMLYY